MEQIKFRFDAPQYIEMLVPCNGYWDYSRGKKPDLKVRLVCLYTQNDRPSYLFPSFPDGVKPPVESIAEVSCSCTSSVALHISRHSKKTKIS